MRVIASSSIVRRCRKNVATNSSSKAAGMLIETPIVAVPMDYAGHCGVKVQRYEVSIYRRLAELLSQTGYPTVTDEPYPHGTGQSCDVEHLIGIGSRKRVW